MAIATLTPQPANGASGLVNAKGGPMPPSANYLQTQEEAKRHKRLDDAWNWYTGDIHGELRSEPGQPDVNVLSNRMSTVVDTGVDFLTGPLVRLEAMRNGKPQDDAQQALDGCWGSDNRRMVTLSKLAQNGGVFGHVFAKIIEPNASKGRRYCRLVPLDPQQLTVVTDPEDCDTVVAYIVDWQQPGLTPVQQQLGMNSGRRQIIVRLDPDDPNGTDENNDVYSYDADATWEISNWVRGPNNNWYQVGDALPWDHVWAPVHDWQNLPLANAHWGMSDIPRNVQHLNGVLNLTLSNINMIAKHHSFPWLYASGVGLGSSIEIGPGKLTQLQAPEAKLAAIEAHGDLAGLLNFAADLRSDMDEQTRVPGVATGRFQDLPKVTSGVALQMLYGPLLSKNTHKQRTYGEGLTELSLRMLSLCGFGDGTGDDGWDVCVHWETPLPNDDAATAQLALAMDQIGTSKHAIYEVLKLDYDTEQEYLADEAKDAVKLAKIAAPAPAMPMAPAPSDGTQSQPQDNAAQPGNGNGGNTPPVNAPQAVAQRNATAAVAKAIKGR